MSKKIIFFIIFCGTLSVCLKAQTTADSLISVQNTPMLKTLWQDYFQSKENRKEKRACYVRYGQLFLKTIYSQVSGPIGYVGYYLNRKKITARLENFYSENNLGDIENIGKDIANGKVDKQCIKNCLGAWYYKLWLYGDTRSPVENGGVPDDYKPGYSMFVRRWFYSGVRNPRWNATYINDYSDTIVELQTVYDTRTDVNTHNYGTGDTKLGTVLRWYTDNEGKWWFFYENIRPTEPKKGKLFYFGAVGLGTKTDGKYSTNASKRGRFEFSLNRTVTIE
ncbi:MAG: hypothetical protein IJ250_02645 [Bacteroidales bacterium]|nr:hypothetical protein [Bacteroidales bacterium]